MIDALTGPGIAEFPLLISKLLTYGFVLTSLRETLKRGGGYTIDN